MVFGRNRFAAATTLVDQKRKQELKIMSSLNFLYETPLLPLIGAILFIWAPWVWFRRNANARELETLTPYTWVCGILSVLIILVVLLF
jgi:hypothetical protein